MLWPTLYRVHADRVSEEHNQGKDKSHSFCIPANRFVLLMKRNENCTPSLKIIDITSKMSNCKHKLFLVQSYHLSKCQQLLQNNNKRESSGFPSQNAIKSTNSIIFLILIVLSHVTRLLYVFINLVLFF